MPEQRRRQRQGVSSRAQGKVTGLGSISLPPADAPDRQVEIPAGLAITADGLRLYVAGNLSNTLLEFELHSGRLLRRFDVGVAPYDVVLVQGKAYVSNWGGRRPGAGDLVASAGLGTLVRVDPVRHIASEGSVTIVNLASGEQTEVVTHLHTSALAVSPDGQFVVCANAGSDNLSVIVTASRRVVETIWAKLNPSELLGATPNALAFAPDGRTLYVANGTQNAIAVINFAPQSRHSKLRGLLPVGWFPGALAFDARRRQLCVANIKGLQSEPAPIGKGSRKAESGYNSRRFQGSLSLVPLPAGDLTALSQTVWNNLRRRQIDESFANDYLERSFASFPRSYPDGMGDGETDALAWSPAGFLWDRAFAQRVSLRNYGEFTGPNVRWRNARTKGRPDFLACFSAWQKKRDDVIFECLPSIATLKPVSPTHYVGWCLEVPDQYRADVILRDLSDLESRGEFPALTLICLPNDHTGGTKPRSATPAAMVADNDLAVGRLVQGFSHWRLWKEMAVLIIEDDPQDGWDHVSGYRTTAYVASPYSRARSDRHAL